MAKLIKHPARPKAKPEDQTKQAADMFAGMFDKLKGLGKPAETYTKKMDAGMFLACRHEFNGKTFEQLEMDTPSATAVASLLIESDIFSAIKMDGDVLDIDAGAIISHLVAKKLMGRFLTIILTREDGSPCQENDFNGKFSEYIRFLGEVITSFFGLNRESLPTIGILLMGGLGVSTVGGQLIATLLAGAKRSGASVKGDQKE